MSTQITKESLIDVNEPRLPRKAYRGTLVTPDARQGHICNIYVVNHRVILAEPREFGHGEIAKRVPGDFDPKDFEAAGGYWWTSTKFVKFWRFKDGRPE